MPPAVSASAPTSTKQETQTRDRIVFAAAELFRRQGYAATGLKQIAAEADAPFGSIYHFFPGGKQQLADEVLRTGGAFFGRLYEMIVREQSRNVAEGIGAFFEGAAETLEATDFQDACPVATVAGEVASTNEVLREATADVFESWIDALTEDLTAAGVRPRDAARLASNLLALLEGAFLLARASRNAEPMRNAAPTAVALTKQAIAKEQR